jgi:YVTN family beta-propeller protein
MTRTTLFIALLSAAIIAACKKPEDQRIDPQIDFSKGTYILNEGAFGSGNSSVTYVSEDGVRTGNVFNAQNNSSLGDVATHMHIKDGMMFLVLNNSAQVTVLNLKTFTTTGVITGCDYPRQFLAVSDSQGVISNGSFAGQVLVVDLQTNDVTQTIDVGKGPEAMLVKDDKLYVTNSGGWDLDSTVSVINLNTMTVEATIQVGHRPNAIETDEQGRIWVLCSGETFYDDQWAVTGHSPASLVVVDNDIVVAEYEILENGDHPLSFAHSGEDQFYLVSGGLYSFDATDVVPSLQLIAEGPFNKVSAGPHYSQMWVTESPDYVSSNSVFLYNSAGEQIEEIEAGIAPVQVIVKE